MKLRESLTRLGVVMWNWTSYKFITTNFTSIYTIATTTIRCYNQSDIQPSDRLWNILFPILRNILPNIYLSSLKCQIKPAILSITSSPAFLLPRQRWFWSSRTGRGSREVKIRFHQFINSFYLAKKTSVQTQAFTWMNRDISIIKPATWWERTRVSHSSCLHEKSIEAHLASRAIQTVLDFFW